MTQAEPAAHITVAEENRMNWKRTVRWSWLIMPFVLLAIWPGIAAAGHNHKPVPPPPETEARDCENLEAGLACIYETTENARFTGEKYIRRISTAAAQGRVGAGSPFCHPNDATKPPCDIHVVATDKINTATGKGPITGKFAIVVNEVTASVPTADGSEVVVRRGTLDGHVDISPALLDGFPLGSIAGRWHVPGVGSGTFKGTLRFPFGFDLLNPACVVDGDLSDCLIAPPFFYVDTGSPGGVRPLATGLVHNEISFARPTLLFEIIFE